MERADHRPATQASASPSGVKPIPIIRTGAAGVLMGLANLVPGVSGGTMILVTGLYDRFVTSVADLTRLKFTRQNLLFIGVLVLVTGVTIGTLSGTMSDLVTSHRCAMYSLFIGMTLGGAPLLCHMIKPFKATSVVAMILGLGLIVLIVVTQPERPELQEEASAGEPVVAVESAYARDVVAGAVGMSAMVLPGISGAYMLLVLGRYETILWAVHQVAKSASTLGEKGDLASSLPVLIPVAIGAIVSIVVLSNFLKWMLRHHERATLGFLLGVLLGSAIGIWPFDASARLSQYGIGAVLAGGGFAVTFLLSRLKA